MYWYHYLLVVMVVACKIAGQTPFKNVSKSHLISNAVDHNSMDGQSVDIDGDGDIDMIIAREFRSNLVLINQGDGRLKDESDIRFPQTQHDSEDIAIGDFDNDGDLDLIFVSEDDQINEFYRNVGNAHFESDPSMIPLNGTSNAVKTADINLDGDLDLVIGNAGQNFLLINHQGRFVDETISRLPDNDYTTQDLELVDIDQDGDLDMIEGNETYNRILINQRIGVFSYEPGRLPAVNDQTRDVEIGDINGDGYPDILFSNVDFGGFGNPQNRLLFNDGKGHFHEVTSTHLPKSNLRTVDSDFLDIDSDGDLDILAGNRYNGLENIVLINDGNGKFTDQSPQFLPPINLYPFDFQIADFNGDSRADIYICGFRSSDVLLFSVE